MEKLRVCFAGIGSIAQRHIRNLRTVCSGRGIELSMDGFRHIMNKEFVDGINQIYFHIEEVPDDYHIIFITNPTELHLETLRQFHEKGKHFFIEKPVVSPNQLEAARLFGRRKESVYYVACPLRYNAVIQYIKNNIPLEDVIAIRSISSSYLPCWRPGKDYRNTYSAHKELGGGVNIDLIHEWDYLTYLFGWPDRVLSMIGQKSSLEINSDDYAVYIADFQNYIAEIHLDYFGRKTIREVGLFMKDDTVLGDIQNNKLFFLCQGKDICFEESRDDFQRRELDHFLDMVLGIVQPDDGYTHGIHMLELAQGKIVKQGR